MIRKLIGQFLLASKLKLPVDLLIKTIGQKLFLPLYHIISDSNVKHIQNLYPIKSVPQFTEDLDFLLKHFDPIDPRDLIAIHADPKSFEKPKFILTFDDGLSQFHDIVAPILLKKGVPAICFLNSGFIDNKGLFFRYKASLLIDLLKNDPQRFKQNEIMDLTKTSNLKSWLLSIKYAERHLLDELAALLGFSFDDYLEKEQPYLKSDQVSSLIQKGFYFGAHGIDHPEFRFLSFEEQIRQTQKSIQAICTQFQLDYKLFAFPFTDYGVSSRFFEEIYSHDMVDLSFGCAGLKKEKFDRHLQRIPFENGRMGARQIIDTELIYYLMKAPFGKNMMRGS